MVLPVASATWWPGRWVWRTYSRSLAPRRESRSWWDSYRRVRSNVSPELCSKLEGDASATTKEALSRIAARARSWQDRPRTVSYTHLRAHETDSYLVCR